MCGRGKQLQIARRLVMVGSRWRWFTNGGALLLGNAIAVRHAPYNAK